MYKELTFPLNVYARLLELDNQPVDYLHFGLFQSKQENVYEAQKHSTEKILAHLPESPANILEIGMGLGTMQKILTNKGHKSQGLTPDTAQFNIASKRLNAADNIHCCTFEAFNAQDKFDVIISQESAQYIDIIHLLSKTNSFLKTNGRFIIIDEVLLNPKDPRNEDLHQPEHLKFLAKSLGMSLVYEEDLSESAQYTMEYIQEQLVQHRDDILELIGQNDAQLQELETATQHYIDCYQQKTYGYYLLVFDKTHSSEQQINYLSENNLTDFQTLFTDAFEQHMSKTLWQWKYQQMPSHALGYWKQSDLVAHYGGFVRDILFFGDAHQAIQIGDTMVAKKERGVMTKNGLFHQLARVFLQRFIGYGAPYLLGFGFPNDRVMKLAETLSLYRSAGKMVRLSWSLQTTIKAHKLYKVRPVSEADQLLVDKLWQQMAKETNTFIVGIRDWQRINYRYLQHPEIAYSVLKICHRITNKPVAIVILKQEGEICHLVDFVSPLKQIPLVLRTAIRFTQQHQFTELYSLVSENIVPNFDTYEYSLADPKIHIPHCHCTQGPSLESVSDKWWLMAGDSDFM